MAYTNGDKYPLDIPEDVEAAFQRHGYDPVAIVIVDRKSRENVSFATTSNGATSEPPRAFELRANDLEKDVSVRSFSVTQSPDTCCVLVTTMWGRYWRCYQC